MLRYIFNFTLVATFLVCHCWFPLSWLYQEGFCCLNWLQFIILVFSFQFLPCFVNKRKRVTIPLNSSVEYWFFWKKWADLLQMQPVSPTKWMGQRTFKPVCFLWRIRWYQICQSCPRRILLLGLPWNIQRKRIQECSWCCDSLQDMKWWIKSLWFHLRV